MDDTGAPPDQSGSFAPVSDPILGAAARVFARRGFATATLGVIADEAQISRSTLYRRYGTREELFEATLLHEVQPQIARSQRTLLGPGPFDLRVEQMLVDAASAFRQNPCLSLLFTDGVRLGDLIGSEGPLLRMLHEVLAPVFGEAQESGVMRPGLDPMETAAWMVQLLVFVDTVSGGDEEATRRAIRTYLTPVLVPDEVRFHGPDERTGSTVLGQLVNQLDHARALAADLKQILP